MASKKPAPVDGAAEPPVPEPVEGSRDERHDSIDPATGALTAEAVALRSERGE